MTRQVVSLDEYRKAQGIDGLRGNVWPLSRDEFRTERAARADQGLRTVICGFCRAASPELDGSAGRAWFSAHTLNGSCSQRVVA